MFTIKHLDICSWTAQFYVCFSVLVHYNGVIMSAMASQITSLTIVYSTVLSRRRSKKTSKIRVTGLCAGNSPVTGEFPNQGPVMRKMFPFDDVIMLCLLLSFSNKTTACAINKMSNDLCLLMDEKEEYNSIDFMYILHVCLWSIWSALRIALGVRWLNLLRLRIT